jgi:hypothetical protein
VCKKREKEGERALKFLRNQKHSRHLMLGLSSVGERKRNKVKSENEWNEQKKEKKGDEHPYR